MKILSLATLVAFIFFCGFSKPANVIQAKNKKSCNVSFTFFNGNGTTVSVRVRDNNELYVQQIQPNHHYTYNIASDGSTIDVMVRIINPIAGKLTLFSTSPYTFLECQDVGMPDTYNFFFYIPSPSCSLSYTLEYHSGPC